MFLFLGFCIVFFWLGVLTSRLDKYRDGMHEVIKAMQRLDNALSNHKRAIENCRADIVKIVKEINHINDDIRTVIHALNELSYEVNNHAILQFKEP